MTGSILKGGLYRRVAPEEGTPTNASPPTLLFFHGAAGNIGDYLEKVHLLHDIGVDVFMIDYHGYGKSGGSPSESGIDQ